MKEASKIMYLIGTIFNVISIVFELLMLVLGIVATAFYKEIYEQQSLPKAYTESQIKSAGLGLIIGCAIALIISIVVLILALRARKKLNNNATDTIPHIVMIVIGAFGDIFYLLGGIFGLVAETSNTTNS